MLFMSDFREAMWGVVQGAVSELDFDFRAYAAEHFERMEATAASPAFVGALERVTPSRGSAAPTQRRARTRPRPPSPRPRG